MRGSRLFGGVGFVSVTLALLAALGCAHEPPPQDPPPQQDQPQPEITETAVTTTDSERERAEALLAEINGWDTQELVALEQPELEPDYLASGETRGFVESRKEQLRELGFDASWDAEAQRYVLVESTK